MSDEVEKALALIRQRIADSDKLLAGRKNEVAAIMRKLERAEAKAAEAEERYRELGDQINVERQQLQKHLANQVSNQRLENFIAGIRGLVLPADAASALATAFAAAFPYYPGGAARLRECGTGLPTRAARDKIHSYLSSKFKSVEQCKRWLSKWVRGAATDFEYQCGWRTMVSYCSDVLENCYNKERHYLDTVHGAELYEHLAGDSPRESKPKQERKTKLF